MKIIVISNGMQMLVDDEDYKELSRWKWSYSTAGYAYRKRYDKTISKYETIFAHRYVLGLKKGDGILIDHRDLNKLNIQKYNLRTANWTQNNANRPSPSIDKKSRYKGVAPVRNCSTWRAYITNNKKQTNLGTYRTEEAAAIAYNDKAIELFGEFAFLNDISEEHRETRLSDLFENYRGVKQIKRGTHIYYQANIQKDGHRIYIGIFKTPEQAARAYNDKAIELFGDKAKLNKIGDETL